MFNKRRALQGIAFLIGSWQLIGQGQSYIVTGSCTPNEYSSGCNDTLYTKNGQASSYMQAAHKC